MRGPRCSFEDDLPEDVHGTARAQHVDGGDGRLVAEHQEAPQRRTGQGKGPGTGEQLECFRGERGFRLFSQLQQPRLRSAWSEQGPFDTRTEVSERGAPHSRRPSLEESFEQSAGEDTLWRQVARGLVAQGRSIE
ncbi:hypothetical protein ACN28E_24140 [Archangium lansingense]|uniref:hypothetical protein n=1 Tax=Archangium lansingense TaxID=2995310 RepID=UPI003B7A68B7